MASATKQAATNALNDLMQTFLTRINRKSEVRNTKWFDKLTTLSQPVVSFNAERVEGQIQNTNECLFQMLTFHNITYNYASD